MIIKSRALVFLSVAVLLSGCVSPQVTRRYAKVPKFPSDVKSGAALSLFSTEVPDASTQTTLLSLSERAQAALIKELGAKAKDGASLLKTLASPIAKPKPQQRVVDKTTFNRRVVLSLENQSIDPAVRIHKAIVAIKLGEDASFKSWSQFATKFQTVDLGSVKFTQANQFGLGVNAAPPQVRELTAVSGSASSSRTLEEDLNLQQRFVQATGSLQPKEARLIQEGAFGIDLTGNVAIDFTVAVGDANQHTSEDVFVFSGLFNDAGGPNTEDLVTVERQTVVFVSPRACHPVTADAQLDATMRAVTKGGETLIEGDDEVSFQRFTQDAKLELIPAEALRFSVWQLADATNHPVHVRKPSSNPDAEVVQFASFDEANDFLLYLAARDSAAGKPLSIKGRELQLNGSALLKSDLKNLRAEIQKLNWDPATGSLCSLSLLAGRAPSAPASATNP